VLVTGSAGFIGGYLVQLKATMMWVMDLKDDDYIEHLFVCSSHDFLLFFTNRGKVYRQKVYELPEAQRTAKGRALVNVLPLREGEFVTLDELMDEVGSDVTRFFFLMRSPSTHLEFDIAQAKEAGEKNPVFYLQYAHARIQSILRKVDDVGQLAGSADLELLTHESEIRLIKAMLEFPEIIQAAAQNKEPHRVINFLNSLASDFTTFYHDCRILGEDEKLMHARATLANAVAQVLANGLGILGISAPDRM
jgi:arginyl-tRNA synthetase